MPKRALGIVAVRGEPVSTPTVSRRVSSNLLTVLRGTLVKKVLAAASLLVLAGAAQAQLSLTGGFPVTFSGYSAEDILGTGPISSGIVGPTIFADSMGFFNVTFLGKETSNLTNFTVDNSTTLRIYSTDPVPATISSYVNPGVLNFTFGDMTDGAVVINGVVSSGPADFAVFGTVVDGVFTPDTLNGAFTYLLGFNDGATANADYDDLVIGIKLTSAVPEPGTYALMLAGLVAFGFMYGRSQRRRHVPRQRS